jgi:hypothetical protein
MSTYNHIYRTFIVYTLRTTTGDYASLSDTADMKEMHKAIVASQNIARGTLVDWGLPFESKSVALIPKTLLPGFLKQMAVAKQSFTLECENLAQAMRELSELPDDAEQKIAAIVRDYTITAAYRTVDGSNYDHFPPGMERLAAGMTDNTEKRVVAVYNQAMDELQASIKSEAMEFVGKLSDEHLVSGRRRSSFRVTRVEKLKLSAKLYLASTHVGGPFAVYLQNVGSWDVDRMRNDQEYAELIKNDALNIANS